MTGSPVSGGCQCGAVRYEITGPLSGAGICHCRMCQKAFGSFFAPLVSAAVADFRVSRGEIAVFRSSDVVERGFCRNCGTPLTFYDLGSSQIDVAIGSLDHPEAVKPVKQVGVEARVSWFGELAALPDSATADDDTGQRLQHIADSNHQHPDRDTPAWTPRPAGTGHSL